MKMLKSIKWHGDKTVRIGDIGRFFGRDGSVFAYDVAEGEVLKIGEDRNFGYISVRTKKGVRLLRN